MPELELNLWLKAEDVEPEAVIRFINAGQASKIPGKEGEPDTPTFEIDVVIPSGDKRRWTMNMTSQRAVAQTYGVNTDLWVDKDVAVYVSKQMVRGKEKKVIYARVPEAEPAIQPLTNL
ncbi:MAG: hypothetical protein KAQ85_00750 [Thermodesulfovibrionia bacterium]|nr:hypothetical protein [Thermodesulfovibrionia bacterium]